MSPLLCLLFAGAAAACAVPARRSVGSERSWRPALLAGLVIVAAIAGWWAVDRPHVLALAVVAAGTALAVGRLVLRHRVDRDAARDRARIVELCDGLEAELRAGQPAPAALDRAAADWPLVAPVSRVAAAGGDVPAALRATASRPGAGELRVLAAAWQVAHRTGHGLADAVGRVAAELRASERTRRIVAGELSSARATARLVAVLPVLALAMGAGAGTDPLAFLFGHPVGIACLAGGVAFGLAGLAWIEAIARSVEREH